MIRVRIKLFCSCIISKEDYIKILILFRTGFFFQYKNLSQILPPKNSCLDILRNWSINANLTWKHGSVPRFYLVTMQLTHQNSVCMKYGLILVTWLHKVTRTGALVSLSNTSIFFATRKWLSILNVDSFHSYDTFRL